MTPEMAAGSPKSRPASVGGAANASGRQLLRNFATSYLGLLVSTLLSLLLTPIVLHRIGSSGYGLWVAITLLTSYVGFVGGGIETAAVQQIAASIGNGDTERLKEVAATARVFFLASGAASGLIVLALVPFVGDVLNISPAMIAPARLSLVLIAVATSAGMVTNIPQTVLVGAGRSDKSALVALVLALGLQGAQIAAVLLGGGYISLFVVSAFQMVVGFAALEYVARRSGIVPSGGRPTRRMLRDLARQGRRNVTVGIGGAIAYNLDAVLVGAILPVAKVTPYDLALASATFVRSASTAGTNLLMPTYAHSAALDDRDRQFRLWSRAILLSLAVTIPMAASLVIYGQALMRLWVGTVPAETYRTLVAINMVFLLQLPGHQSFIFLTGVGKNAMLARLSFFPSLANLGLSIGATFWLGPMGPAIGSLPQVVVLDAVVLPILCCRQLDVPLRRFLREAIAPLAVPSAAAVAVGLGLLAALGNGSLLLAPFQCGAVCVVAWIAFTPVLLRRDPALRSFASRLVRPAGKSDG